MLISGFDVSDGGGPFNNASFAFTTEADEHLQLTFQGPHIPSSVWSRPPPSLTQPPRLKLTFQGPHIPCSVQYFVLTETPLADLQSRAPSVGVSVAGPPVFRQRGEAGMWQCLQNDQDCSAIQSGDNICFEAPGQYQL